MAANYLIQRADRDDGGLRSGTLVERGFGLAKTPGCLDDCLRWVLRNFGYPTINWNCDIETSYAIPELSETKPTFM